MKGSNLSGVIMELSLSLDFLEQGQEQAMISLQEMVVNCYLLWTASVVTDLTPLWADDGHDLSLVTIISIILLDTNKIA